jgi:hypothetical protein
MLVRYGLKAVVLKTAFSAIKNPYSKLYKFQVKK